MAQGQPLFPRVGEAPSSAWKAFGPDTVYLSTAPFYHAAPVRWNMAVLRAGGSCVMLEKFDAAAALAAIATHRVTHSQWVPTMFIRLLRAGRGARAMTCPRCATRCAARAVPGRGQAGHDPLVGPILYEYYSGTELVGRTSLGSEEWLAHPGSVGRRVRPGAYRQRGRRAELPPGSRASSISRAAAPEYHKDPAKTRKAYNARGWATYGDIGYLDADGYLYPTDRLSNMIVSGGVNIYPQEAENPLLHASGRGRGRDRRAGRRGEAVRPWCNCANRRTRVRRWRRR